MRSVVAAALRKVGGEMLSWLYPHCCVACGEVLPCGGSEVLCAACDGVLAVRPAYACAVCGRGMAQPPGADGVCTDCQEERYAFVRVYPMYPYNETVRGMILRYKNGGHTAAARDIATLMVARFPLDALPAIDMLVPVPPRRESLRERGFGQTVLLARHLARLYGLPCGEQALAYVRATRKQGFLNADERRKNVDSAFGAADATAGKRILLLDDVFTTGSTANACARALMEAGAKVVYVMTVAASIREA